MTDKNDFHFGMIPSSGQYNEPNDQEGYWYEHFVLPQGISGLLSSAGWTRDNLRAANVGNEGFIQQTFLGASIRDFNLNAGFGDSTSTLSLNLVNDEYNLSDRSRLGEGDDHYHGTETANAKYVPKADQFKPPPVGTPVYFKFGKNPASVEQAYRQTFDDLYKVKTLPDRIEVGPASENAFNYEFPRITVEQLHADGFGPDFSKVDLQPYFLYDEITGTIEDRSLLWDKDTYWRGRNHFVFGGILQSYTENRGQGGKPVYAVNVNDPREILSNVQILFNNYQGTTFNNKNILNLYGFLEHDPSVEMLEFLAGNSARAGIVEKRVLDNGRVLYNGFSSYWDRVEGWKTDGPEAKITIPSYTWNVSEGQGRQVEFPQQEVTLLDQYYIPKRGKPDGKNPPEFWPITGQGFSRRSEKGMPWYRISQGLAAMFRYYGEYPLTGTPFSAGTPEDNEFLNAGFGSQINFRGFNYVVDFGGIPTEKIPLLYYMDFDKLDLLSFAQELCDIISHELFVSLLPVIDHPSCEFLYNYNKQQVLLGKKENIVAGIIRLDAIDKTQQPRYGAIKSYLDNLNSRGVFVENRDIGFELSNVVTDKFLVGGQEVDMYYFSTERDRDELQVQRFDTEKVRLIGQRQWDLTTMLQQQAIPYYGMIGEKAVTIPRGFGGYQQILLDSSSLNAFGVGNQYIATEMELRAALVSYKSWKNFLLSYNDTFIEDVSEHSAFLSSLNSVNDQIDDVMNDFKTAVDFDGLDSGSDKDVVEGILNRIKGKQYAVTVPRCVFRSDKEYLNEYTDTLASPCSPPFGYPLYYKRATRIGILEAGVGKIINAKTKLVTDTVELKKEFENSGSPLLEVPSKNILKKRIDKLETQLRKFVQQKSDTNQEYKTTSKYKEFVKNIEEAKKVYKNWDALQNNLSGNEDRIAEVEAITGGADGEGGLLDKFLYNIDKTAKKHDENAKKVYEFVRKVAEECLGKKFLVRIPKRANVNFKNRIKIFDGSEALNNIQFGPFGFKPRAVDYNPNVETSPEFLIRLELIRQMLRVDEGDVVHHYLKDYQDPLDHPKNLNDRLPIAASWDGGALKGNYNPFSEQWEWNYKPEPQGGYFTYDQFGINTTALDYTDILGNWSKLPLAIQQGLCPMDVTNFMSQSNRMQCYVKYENSHLLEFGGVNGGEMSQQTISYGGTFMPDVVEQLPNNNESKPDLSFSSLEEYEKGQRLKERQPPSMAFVRCELDEKFYMPPKLEKKSTDVWAREYEMKLTVPEPEIRAVKDSNNCTTKYITDYPDVNPIFSVPKDGGKDGYAEDWWCFKRNYDPVLEADIIESDTKNLDDEHVYALVTVPGRIKSTADIRWKDGPLQAFKSVEKKHLMMQDVVFMNPAFSKPNLAETNSGIPLACGPAPVFDTQDEAEAAASGYGLTGSHYLPSLLDYVELGKAKIFGGGYNLPESGYRPGKPENWLQLTLGQITEARKQTKIINQGFIAGQPQVSLGYSSPSPIVPDLFVIPLMSMERCYGPWVSASQLDPGADARIKFSDIGGKVEFVKDEELTPWNYAGYQLLNEAGSTKANFSNSLLLFSERGGFVIPDAPTGIALATALQNEGPLITSIGISVSEGGVKTTVKLDLYTSQFGKLAKQKEMAISQIARERQKLTDEKNAATRRGLGKRSTSSDLVNSVMQAGGKTLLDTVEKNSAQREANRELGEELDEQVLIVGSEGGTMMTTRDMQRVLQSDEPGKTMQNLSKNSVGSLASMFLGYSTTPSEFLPNKVDKNNEHMDNRTNDGLNREN
tara:strand:- start:6530 stop:11851 length:5322 start_codon:yes stop_codon:yes gene_type:complete